MEGIEVKVQKRAFPSRGRARIHTSLLSDLAVEEGGSIEIAAGEKVVKLGAFADSMVAEGVVRMDPEDMKKIGVDDGATVVVRRATPLMERLKKDTKGATEKISKEATDVGGKISKGAGSAAESVKKGAGSAAESVKKGAGSAAEKVKKTVSPDKKDRDL